MFNITKISKLKEEISTQSHKCSKMNEDLDGKISNINEELVNQLSTLINEFKNSKKEIHDSMESKIKSFESRCKSLLFLLKVIFILKFFSFGWPSQRWFKQSV